MILPSTGMLTIKNKYLKKQIRIDQPHEKIQIDITKEQSEVIKRRKKKVKSWISICSAAILIFILYQIIILINHNQAWKETKRINTIESYQDYINKFPNTNNSEQIYNKYPQLESMVFVQGGSFQMGSNDGGIDEKPVHSVTLSDFFISKTEVTQKEWKDIMGSNPSHFKGDNLPVEKVSWNDIQSYINKLNTKTGLNYRLPTEAEWEYAARGGVKTQNSASYKYSGSNNIDEVAWYSSNSSSKTHSVGSKQPNELGIYDMSGNVWEWCNDWYDSSYYKNSPKNNPQGASSGSRRVLRGGSWYDRAGLCRVAYRNNNYPDRSRYDLGFRLLRSSK